jgi:hypothetical protein
MEFVSSWPVFRKSSNNETAAIVLSPENYVSITDRRPLAWKFTMSRINETASIVSPVSITDRRPLQVAVQLEAIMINSMCNTHVVADR